MNNKKSQNQSHFSDNTKSLIKNNTVVTLTKNERPIQRGPSSSEQSIIKSLLPSISEIEASQVESHELRVKGPRKRHSYPRIAILLSKDQLPEVDTSTTITTEKFSLLAGISLSSLLVWQWNENFRTVLPFQGNGISATYTKADIIKFLVRGRAYWMEQSHRFCKKHKPGRSNI
ncbi:hypothetical protein [Pseudomonas sp. MM227]|uniref:hypothetical protein n=1 Tax=Pseudomonas sp. MM227 TaxID=3019968 RepID=UPI00221F2058|nr:hypothetical protein [Pseudomonas sp. MM227]